MSKVKERGIGWIIIHCSDSNNPDHDNIETIRQWHVKERKFNDIGYHYVILKNGTIEKGRDENVIGAHCKGHNDDSIGICLTGKDKDRFTPAQFNALEILLIDILGRHGLDKRSVLAHSDLDPHKTCPNFDLDAWLTTRNWS